MVKRIFFFIFLFCIGLFDTYGQADVMRSKDTIKTTEIDPLRPAKAAFYSAILPGLGQAYNKKYWKIPLVYGAIGTSVYFYIDNQKKYNTYRDEYKNRLEGKINKDDYLRNLNDNQLIAAQKQFQRNRDLSAFFIVGFYVLNIVDANIDAAISQFNVSESLSFKPIIENQSSISNQKFSIACIYVF
ncbi:DUF5683 domain-containing protein [Flavobacterium collinsii]|uniref:DUF5683 domain-containing protein n=2 Tax=Flavobacterium TaxID=237 RepID=A0ABN7EPH8_9FLAO|nr:hypothetical protein FLACOL7796_04063 [Flavobacterium collinsii]